MHTNFLRSNSEIVSLLLKLDSESLPVTTENIQKHSEIERTQIAAGLIRKLRNRDILKGHEITGSFKKFLETKPGKRILSELCAANCN